ncbi:MAG: hypothetical protein HQ582_31585, partial [Planctomycetes bacterium]|nr:hypothetical protein [Planctomycetota bacterium]
MNKKYAAFITVLLLTSLGLLDSLAGESDDIVARIGYPYNHSLIRGNVPIFGVAHAKEFYCYELEFGEGSDPEEWHLIKRSYHPEYVDPYDAGKVKINKNWGMAEGNLGLWTVGLDEYPYGQAFKHNLQGVYTVRLTVRTRKGRVARHAKELTVARVLLNVQRGIVTSPDKIVSFAVAPDSLDSHALLVSLLPNDSLFSPPKELIQLSSTYEFRPPALSLVKPATLGFKLPREKSEKARKGRRDILPRQIAIYQYDAPLKQWIALPSHVDLDNESVSTTVSEVLPHLALYVLLADMDPPAAPILEDEVPDVVYRKTLYVKGKAEPHAIASINLNGNIIEEVCDQHGGFAPKVQLKPGENKLVAYCRDRVGNQSPPTPEHTIVLDYKHPDEVQKIEILEHPPGQHSKLLVKVSGTGRSEEQDATLVRIFSDQTDPRGLIIEAIETKGTSGIYTAHFQVGSTTDDAEAVIAAKVDGETIVAAWGQDEKICAERTYRDRAPPSSPVIACEGRLCWSSFDDGTSRILEQWQPVDGEYGAKLSIETEDGNAFLRSRPGRERGHMGLLAWAVPYSVRDYPIVSFDFRAATKATVDMLIWLEKYGPRGIALTDEEPFYARVGKFHGVKADGAWHHAEINLFSALHERFPDQEDFIVTRIEVADWDGGDRIFGTKFFGSSARAGCFYDIDNFAISNPHSMGSFGIPTFTWSADDDSGIAGYSWLLDDKPNSMPDEKITGTETTKTYEELDVGRWWFHVRAQDNCGNWGPANHYSLVVDFEPPVIHIVQDEGERVGFDFNDQLLAAAYDVGSGPDPSSFLLEVDGRQYRVDDSFLRFDPSNGALTLWPSQAKPFPIWFVNDFPINLKLGGVRDYAGSRLPEEKSWRVVADSPITLNAINGNGWCTAKPVVALRPKSRSETKLTWMRTLKGDGYAKRGCYIREIAVQSKKRGVGNENAGNEIPLYDGRRPPRFVAEVKVDTTVPKT